MAVNAGQNIYLPYSTRALKQTAFRITPGATWESLVLVPVTHYNSIIIL